MTQTMQSRLQNTRLAHDFSQSELAALLKICLALNCKLEDILPDGETTELLRRYMTEQAG